LIPAIEVGAEEIGPAAFVSTLCICIVFVPMFFLPGVARFLFVPLAESVVFAMIASYFLSRTLVPTLVMMLMDGVHEASQQGKPSLLQRVYRSFDAQFERVRRVYTLSLSAALTHRKQFMAMFFLFCVLSCGIYPFLGRDFFPTVDAGQIRLHMRAPTGTRIEETARIADAVETAIREMIPEDQLDTILDNIGLPNSGINLSYSNAGTIGTMDGEILMSLKKGHQRRTKRVDCLVGQFANSACFLAQPSKRCGLQRGGAGTAVQNRLYRCTAGPEHRLRAQRQQWCQRRGLAQHHTAIAG
jgi:multidrug efflux pump subunit AcrB